MNKSNTAMTRHLAALAASCVTGVVLLPVFTNPALAGSCVGAGAPYTIGAQNDTVELDTDCAAAGGAVTITGDVNGDGGGGTAVILDQGGNDQNWALTVNPGVTVQGLLNFLRGIRFESPGGSVDNSGTVRASRDAVEFTGAGVTGTINNRTGATMESTSGSGVTLGAGGSVTNSGTITGSNNSTGLVLHKSATLTNSGTITGGRGIILQKAAADADNDTVVMSNSGTITGTLAGSQALSFSHKDSSSLTITNTGQFNANSASATILINSFSQLQTTITNSGQITNNGTGRAIQFNTLAATNDRLELQPGSQIAGDVEAGGGTDTLAFGGTGTMTVDVSQIDGNNTDNGEQFLNFETFVKEDGSTVNLTGTNTEIGAFAVNNGLLNQKGTMASTAFTVNNGGTLGGAGTIGSLNALVGGAVAPGNSIGTLTVMGNVAFAANSIYQAELAADGTSDLINATGTATINGGEVQVTFTDPEDNYEDGKRYTILTATGGVTGTFTTLTENSALIDATLTYDANNVFIDLMIRQTGTGAPDFPAFAQTPNQRRVATSLVGFDFTGDNADLLNALLGLNGEGLRRAYDALGSEGHNAAQFASNNSGAFFSRSLFNQAGGSGGNQTFALGVPTDGISQLTAYAAVDKTPGEKAVEQALLPRQPAEADAGPPGVGEAIYGSGPTLPDASAADTHLGPSVWMSGLYGHAEVDGDANASGFTADSWGLAGGIEQRLGGLGFDDVTVGLGIGYSASYSSLDQRTQSSTSDDYHIGLYGNGGAERLVEGFNWRLAGSYSFHDIRAKRSIAFGAINRLAEGKYSARTFSGSAEARYNFDASALTGGMGRTTLAPLVRASVSSTQTDRFTETGAGALNLTVQSSTFTQTWLGAGIGLSGDYDLGAFTWRPNWTVAYEYNVGNDEAASTATLAGSAVPFTSRGPREDRSRFRFGSSTTFDLSDTASLTLASDSTWSPDRTEWSAKATFKLQF